MSGLEQALAAVAEALSEAGVKFALVGGLAVSARAEPRFTRDADLAVAVPSDAQAEALVRSLMFAGYSVLAQVEQEASGRLATVRLAPPGFDEAGIVVDLLFASSGIEPEVVAAADLLRVTATLSLPVASLAHLVALKVLSRDDTTRPQDRIDLSALLAQASRDDIAASRCALELVRERGYARGRQVVEALDAAMVELRRG